MEGSMTKKRKRLKLTKGQKKMIHAEPNENAGVGWRTDYPNNVDPRLFECGNDEE
jgi:hypothetical protein